MTDVNTAAVPAAATTAAVVPALSITTPAARATIVAAAIAPVLSPVSPGPWTLDVSQRATVLVTTVPGVGRISPALASAPAGMTVVGLPIGADTIDPLTVDGDGRVHSDGT